MKFIGWLVVAAAGLSAQESFEGSARIDALIDEALQAEQMPGAVALVYHKGRILHRKAYGKRALTPVEEAMTVDTIFDAASLTKVVATSSSIAKLMELGKLRLNDKVTEYLPGFQRGKSDITVRHLLTHFSGLRPDLDLKPEWSGYELGIQKALIDKPVAAPGQRFIYSDINFILLGEIVRKVSGKPLDEFAQEAIFGPLGMKDTGFRPAASLRPRIAPTEKYPGMAVPLRGVVHDETTRFMGGLAGHAGLFTTAQDLSFYAAMLLSGGEWNGKRILSPLTVRKMTEPQTPPDQTILRGIGVDIDSPYSANRGELFPLGSYGHTGFTGTSLWMDPVTETAVILLTNSVHPFRRPPVTALRAKVATVVAAALGVDAPGVSLTGYNETISGGPNTRRAVARTAEVQTGLDVLVANGFAPFQGKRVGLITNHTGINRDGKRNIDLMVAAGVNLVALFSPEHGISGKEDHENVGDSKDPASGLPVYSMYRGERRGPNEAALAKVDVLVFDIQDIGARFYTYGCSMLNALEAASKMRLPFVVLDRPNPITGVRVEGPMMDRQFESFVGCWEMPLRHGMTMGELARMFHGERKMTGKLDVVAMKAWQRGDWFDATGLPWIDPSPNIRSLQAALLFPGVAMLEYSRNYTVGRGTQTPFEVVGSDWLNARSFAAAINARNIPGVRVYPTSFTPNDSNLKGKLCQGLRFLITDRERYNSVRFGLELAVMMQKMYPGKIVVDVNKKLIGNQKVMELIAAGTDPRTIETEMDDRVQAFLPIREKYLIYK